MVQSKKQDIGAVLPGDESGGDNRRAMVSTMDQNGVSNGRVPAESEEVELKPSPNGVKTASSPIASIESSLLDRQKSNPRAVRFHILTHQESTQETVERQDSTEVVDIIGDGVASRSHVSKMKSGSIDSGDSVPLSFLRTDSIIFRVKPGQCFTEYASLVVDSPAASDPKLGTLGELRHHLRTGTSTQVCKVLLVLRAGGSWEGQCVCRHGGCRQLIDLGRFLDWDENGSNLRNTGSTD